MGRTESRGSGHPEQVPQINGEYEYLAAFTPEVRE
jgi:hypothetical protein